ncbi:Conserved_hypothetical protein [Hexamita inflata]|uniref:Uncharacterized protein n=1 Tax=Hexamita inflata TaxID=28002 RepID=A0AA86PE47_9EUKA|nr:Conserved hypothetical protein [Hexamita inflata]
MSLASTHAMSITDQTPSSFSVTNHDTVQSTIDKLRHRCVLLQQRRKQALKQFEDSEKRVNNLKSAVTEAETRNDKLSKKLTYFRENLQNQINDGLTAQQERLLQLQSSLSEMKERYQNLEDSRRKIQESNFSQKNKMDQQMHAKQMEKEQLRDQINRYQANEVSAIDTQKQLDVQLRKLFALNTEKQQQYAQLVLQVSRSQDEDYSVYVKQIIDAKDMATNFQDASFANISLLSGSKMQKTQMQNANQLSNSQRMETLTNFFVNKCEYGNDWTKDLKRPKTEQNTQVNTQNRNMNTSITVFDRDNGDNYTFQQQVVEKTPIIRKNGQMIVYDEQKPISAPGSAFKRNVNFQSSPQYQPAQTKRNTTSTATQQIQRPQTTPMRPQIKHETLSPNFEQKTFKSNLKTLQTQNKSLQKRLHKAEARTDIIFGLEAKIQDATEQKAQLNRRLDAVNSSYQNTRDKIMRVQKIENEILSKNVELKLLKDRLKKVKAMK